jgi:CubicO group peptidase (beta-lactamase class C family)
VPGTRFQYSGGGYCVLQQLLINVTQTPFPKLMHDEVLGPLGMKHSTYAQPLPQPWQADTAVAHNDSEQPLAGNWNLHPEMAAAGLWTTPSDLALFLLAVSHAQRHEKDAILKPALADAMFTRQFNGFGLGIAVRGQGRSLAFWHSGANAGFRCFCMCYPATGQGAVLMTNSDNGDRLNMEFLDDLRIEYAWQE